MTLRTRLLATSVAVALPLALGLFFMDERLRFADMTDRVEQLVDTELASGVRDRCLARDGLLEGPPGVAGGGALPPRGARRPRAGGPARAGQGAERPGYRIGTFGADFSPPRVGLPAIDPELRRALETPGADGALPDSVTMAYDDGRARGIERAVWLDRTAPTCALLVARVPEREAARRDQFVALGLITLSAMAAAWIAAGPVIARLRRLSAGVQAAADSRYETAVPVAGNDEVAELATAFNAAGAKVRAHLIELQHREDALRAFVANTAHDVGVPLTVLQGHLAALSEPSTTAADSRQATIRAAIGETHYLASLIRNLDAATRLEHHSLPLQSAPIDLGQLVERVVSRHRTIAAAASVELNEATPEAAVVVRADPTLLEQAVSNLVDNAIRYNRPGGHAAVVLNAFGDRFEIVVRDDGPGVEPDDLSRLTEARFRSMAARTRRPDGQGLGLAITAEAVRRLGFTLTFARGAEAGLVATITGRMA
jgi:signal transduction histidine kinase